MKAKLDLLDWCVAVTFTLLMTMLVIRAIVC